MSSEPTQSPVEPQESQSSLESKPRKVDSIGSPKVRQAALSFIFVTVLLDVLSLALLIPILPTLIEREFLDGVTV